MELYLIRHGVTDWNEQGKLQGHSDIPLNEEGRRMAEKTGEGLGDLAFDAVYVSPLSRARETAAIILGDRGPEARADRRLMEIGFGALEGADYRTWAEGEDSCLARFYNDPAHYVPPEGGESFVELCARADSFLQEIIRRHGQEERVLVVAHNGINHALLRFLEGRPVEALWEGVHQDNCAAAIIEVRDGTFRVLERNRKYY